MHDSFKRLLDFARSSTADQQHQVVDSNDLRQRMSLSSQALHNWTSRGVSVPGAVDAEATFGCSAVWVLTGKHPPHPKSMLTARHVVAEPAITYSTATPPLGQTIITLAAQLKTADVVARGAIAPLLSQLATDPDEAESVAAMIEALIAARRKRAG